MLAFYLCIYLLCTLLIGLWASRRVKNNTDYLVAGKSLPLYLEIGTLFATWFGAETVLGSSATMYESGLSGVTEEPFGASLCLFLVGALFARRLYRLNVLTLSDFYNQKFGGWNESLSAVIMIVSYFGWIAAQFLAIGVVIHLIVPELSLGLGIAIGALLVFIYTFFGGMWSISTTDIMQSVIIIFGLLACLWQMNSILPLQTMIKQTPISYFHIYEAVGFTGGLNYFAAWIVIGLGSIPQQDVFQRINSAKNAKVAVQASYIGGVLYLTISLIPLILALYARHLGGFDYLSSQELLLPALIEKYMSTPVKILFFGALLSAIMSTASGAILAPAAVLSENIIGRYFTKSTSKNFALFLSRLSVLIITLLSLLLAYSGTGIYELVGDSSSLSLVSLFVPLCIGLFLPKYADRWASLASMLSGLFTWVYFNFFNHIEVHAIIPGLTMSMLAYGVVYLVRLQGIVSRS